MRAFAHGEGVGGGLAQSESVPHGPMVYQVPVLGVEALILRYALAAHLPHLPVGLPVQRQHATAHQRLHRLGPHAAVSRGKGHMAVIGGLAHGHLELHTQAADEVAVHVAVEHKRMHHPDFLAARIEIEADGEGQPQTAILTGIAPFEPDHGPHVADALHDGPLHPSFIAGKAQGLAALSRRTVLRGAQQSGRTAHLAPLQAKAVHQTVALLGDAGLQCSSGYYIRGRGLVHAHRRRGAGTALGPLPQRLETHRPGIGRNHGGHTGPLDRPVGPIGQRPTVRGDGRAVSPPEADAPAGLQLPFEEGYAQTHRTVHRRAVAHPMQFSRHRLLAINSRGAP